MRVLIDGDVLVYRAGFAAEKTHYTVTWEEDGASHSRDFTTARDMNSFLDLSGVGDHKIEVERRVEPVENALYNVKSIVKNILTQLHSTEDDLTIVLSGPTNFRNGIGTIKPYKGNRDPTHKPVHGPDIKEYMKKRYNHLVSEDEEADDLIGYTHYAEWQKDPHGSVIVTIDKDLDMIPGLHYNFVTERTYEIAPDEAMYLFYRQLITGDTVDNIPGIPGMGKVKAAAALKGAVGEKEMYDKVRTLYVQSYPDNPDEALLENARLLWIRRHPNEWWKPPEENE